MTDITVHVDINRSPEDVFAVLADLERNPEWQTGQRACVWTSDPPIREGSTYDQEAAFLGRTIRSSFEVTEFEPGSSIRIVATSGPMPIDVRRTVSGLEDGQARATARVQGTPPGMMRFFGPLIDVMVRRNVEADYQRLKQLLEAP